MTPPRRILPGAIVEVTQRTLGRTFRFPVTSEIRQLVLYVLGVAAQRYNMSLFGFVLMATHYHLLALDRDGRLPEFQQYVDSLIARALNVFQGRSDKVWSGRGYVTVTPQDRPDLLGRLIYGMANPVAAGLVKRAADFPGLVILPEDIGRELVIERPKRFFRPNGKMPERVTLRFEVPPEFAELGVEGYRKLLSAQLRDREQEHRMDRRTRGTSVVGARRLRRIRVGATSVSREQPSTMRPLVAAKLKADRTAAVRALVAFQSSYREALECWRDGDHGVEFPVGTWKMCRFAGAAVG